MYQLDPPALFAHESVVNRQPDRSRMERVVRATGRDPSDVIVFEDEALPDLIREHDLLNRPTMGTVPEVRDPRLLFNTFRFDGRRQEREAWLAERAPVGNKLLRLALLGYGAFDWVPAGLEEDPHRDDKVCRACWRLHFQHGCVQRCRYCGEGGLLVTMTNVEDYIEQLDKLIAAHPWQLTYLFEDDADVPCLEPELGVLGPLVEHFGTLEDRYLIIHTKSANFDWMRELDHGGHTIVVWSLSARTQSREIEPRTGTTEERIEAARRLQEAGYPVRYKFKPIIPVVGWREELAETIELALLLEGRVDEHHPAALLRRQQRLERGPAVERQHLRLVAVRKELRQRRVIIGVELVDHEAIACAHQAPRDERAAGIARERPCAVDLAHRREIGRQDRSSVGRQPGVDDAADAGPPFAGLEGGLRTEIVEAHAGMRVDDAEWRRLQF